MLEGSGAVRELAHASTLCGACQDVCPVRIDIPRMLVALRERLDREGLAPWRERVAFRALGRVLTSPGLYRTAARLGRLLQRPFARQGRISHLPGPLARWTAARDLSRLARRSFAERWQTLDP
jgi:L-lactate dehydrogenase complex protein LldF